MSIVNLRIQNKHDITQNWNEIQNSFIPYSGEIIIYDDYKIKTSVINGESINTKIPGVKIGDGQHVLKDLEFVSNIDPELNKVFQEHINNDNIHISSEDRKAWNDNISYQVHEETLSLLKRGDR